MVHAAPVVWTGLGSSDLWSDASNWNPIGVPADATDLEFGGLRPRATSLLDLSRSFDSIAFRADAGAFFLHVSGYGGSTLNLFGAGLRNLTAGTGPILQSLFADAGSSAGTLSFSGSAGVNVGLGYSARAVDLVARGAGSVAQSGGHIVFQDLASVGTDTFDTLHAEGASAGMAPAADIVFRGSALADRFSAIVVDGATAGGALGGFASFNDLARAAGSITLLAGSGGGPGGRADFAGKATLAATASLFQQGAESAAAGGEAATTLHGDAKMIGSAQNGEGASAGASGGRLEFHDRASHDTRGLDASLGIQTIYNTGSSASGAGGGVLIFRDDSFVAGTQLYIHNATGEYDNPGSGGGSTEFRDRARAGAATIDNAGAHDSTATSGSTRFLNQASAESARIVMRGGNGAMAAGGNLRFGDDASASAAQLRNEGGSVGDALGGATRFSARATAGSAAIANDGGAALGARGGTTLFEDMASAASARIVNSAGAINGASGGVTTFAGGAGAGQAFISNQTSASAGGGGRGSTFFMDTSSAQQATIDNQGGSFTINAFTVFSQSATAGNALITNFGGNAAGVVGGFTNFTDRSNAGAATLVMAGGGVDGALGGSIQFFDGTSAGSATLNLLGASVVGGAGGTVYFGQGASAGNAQVAVQGSQSNGIGGPEGAVVSFFSYVSGAASPATASTATFTIGGNRFAFGSAGRVRINDGSTAADASFTTLAGFDAGGKLSFEGSASHLSTAGNARITNGSRATASASTGDFGGATLFGAHSTADHANITNEAGRTAFGAQTVFRADSSADDARITNAGGLAGETGGITFFQDTSIAGRALIFNQAGALNANGLTRFGNTSSAAQAVITASGASVSGGSGGRVSFNDRSTAALATLVAEGGSNGGAGGRIEFQQQATGGIARIVLGAGSAPNADGVLDISGVDVWLSVGSIEGGGSVNLGSRALIVGGSGKATTFSGVISGAAPPVFPSLSVLGGSLTLSGANLYAGRTSIGDGVNAGSGKLIAANATGSATGSGAVRIERGGTLGGSGFIAGPVTLVDGGTIAPGDPVTLTLRDSLVWNGGGVIRLVLGADDAGSDHLVGQRLVRGTPGSFTFELVNAGITPGASYSLFQFDAVEGFTADDFSLVGLGGNLALVNGTLGLTAAVPEPSEALLFLAGLLCLMRFCRSAERVRSRRS
ncbi:MAG: hypothetical protein ABI343_09025 [Burkholderiaceae bacterium]